jgi:hypothetical protein
LWLVLGLLRALVSVDRVTVGVDRTGGASLCCADDQAGLLTPKRTYHHQTNNKKRFPVAGQPSASFPLLAWLRLPPRWARIVGACLVAIGLIWAPWFSPYYRVPAGSLRLIIPEGGRTVTFEFRNEVTRFETTLDPPEANAPTMAPEVIATDPVLVIRVPQEYRGRYLQLRSIEAADIDLRSVTIDQQRYDARDLGTVVEPRGQFRRDQLVREGITDFIFKYNETLSNYALAFMVSVFAYFSYQLVVLYADLVRSGKVGRADEVRGRLDRMREQRRSFEFWRIAAPSLGFLMTVSSLAAALHPSVQATRNAAQFLAAVDVAVISTFVGLMVRLVAHLCCVTDSAIRRNLTATP